VSARRLLSVCALALACMGTECVIDSKGGGTGGGADTASDADADADADSDADTDADTDTDVDISEPPDTIECDPPYDTPSTGNCVTEEIFCGDRLLGNNIGGSELFEADGQFEQCSGSASGADFAGPERVYKFVAPPGIGSLSVLLESCEASWLLWYQDTNECPGTSTKLSCDYPPAFDSTFYVQGEEIVLGPSGTVYFVVEGFQNDGGNFAISLECY